MPHRNKVTTALALTAFAVTELVLSIVALGHRHSHLTSEPAAIASTCSHHHSHSCSDGGSHDESAHSGSESQRADSHPADSHGPDGQCSICRYLAQVAVSVSMTQEVQSQALFEVVVQSKTFDVEKPAYLIPQPRSPPAAV